VNGATDDTIAAGAQKDVVGRAGRMVTLLGGFRLTLDEHEVTVPASTQRIIALVALRGRCGRSQLAGLLWPETTELRAHARLRTAIWRANQVAPGLVESAHDSVGLAANVQVDVTRLVRTAHGVMEGRATFSLDSPGLRYVEGDLLPDWTEDWLVVDRERLRQLRLHLLDILASQLADRGSFGLAMDVALAALQSDTLRESAHRAVIRIHLAEGNHHEALHAYRECCAILARELGLLPSAETARLVRSMDPPRVVAG
jgi:DNA-binding SARP family transcriptional activator